jgi:hypothetical protein
VDLNSLIKTSNWATLAAHPANEQLQEVLDRFKEELTAFSENLTSHFFSHTEPRIS